MGGINGTVCAHAARFTNYTSLHVVAAIEAPCSELQVLQGSPETQERIGAERWMFRLNVNCCRKTEGTKIHFQQPQEMSYGHQSSCTIEEEC